MEIPSVLDGNSTFCTRLLHCIMTQQMRQSLNVNRPSDICRYGWNSGQVAHVDIRLHFQVPPIDEPLQVRPIRQSHKAILDTRTQLQQNQSYPLMALPTALSNNSPGQHLQNTHLALNLAEIARAGQYYWTALHPWSYELSAPSDSAHRVDYAHTTTWLRVKKSWWSIVKSATLCNPKFRGDRSNNSWRGYFRGIVLSNPL